MEEVNYDDFAPVDMEHALHMIEGFAKAKGLTPADLRDILYAGYLWWLEERQKEAKPAAKPDGQPQEKEHA